MLQLRRLVLPNTILPENKYSYVYYEDEEEVEEDAYVV